MTWLELCRALGGDHLAVQVTNALRRHYRSHDQAPVDRFHIDLWDLQDVRGIGRKGLDRLEDFLEEQRTGQPPNP